MGAATEGRMMAKGKLSRQEANFFDLISTKNVGDELTTSEILEATTWKKSTFDTHVRKNKLDHFLLKLSAGAFRVLKDGATLSKADISTALTQVSPGTLVLTKGTKAPGEVDTYTLQEFLGNGAVAHVWKALGSTNMRGFAVKVMNPRVDLLDPAHLDNVRKRFRSEARNGRTINHPNVVSYVDVGEIKANPFLVMDLADESLAQILERNPLTIDQSIKIMRACVAGLSHLHELGCVHRDIKPANVLRFDNLFALGDLGIVHWSDMHPDFTSAATITRASLRLGSWNYMAPEQRRSPDQPTPANDVYSLGVTWYETLKGDLLDPAEVAAKQYPPPSRNDELNELISRMLNFRPTDRPTVMEVQDRIEAGLLV